QLVAEAVEAGVYNDAYVFRVVPGFVVQFGIPGDPKLSEKWSENTIKDEPVKHSNKRGTVTFAKKTIPNTRTTQIFVNLSDENTRLDSMGFAPFGEVVEGMEVVDKFNAEYGGAPSDEQMRIQLEGNKFLAAKYPKLDKIEKAEIVKE
ncbi:MAG: peptidylprolyl isomerase, partial [Candidatus Hydrogenedentales bacterium]